MTLFDTLKQLLTPVAKSLIVSCDEPGNFSLNTTKTLNGKPIYFGGVRLGKRYTSFYFMPAYFYKDLLKNASPNLRLRKHGEACFNFTAVDRQLFDELREFVEVGLERMKEDGLA